MLFDCANAAKWTSNGLSYSRMFYINWVEVGNGHQGTCDLGLRIAHETMVHLEDEWNMTVMLPRLMSADQLVWPEENHRFGIHPSAFGGTKNRGTERISENSHFQTRNTFFETGIPASWIASRIAQGASRMHRRIYLGFPDADL
jgi:hypothetical protein